MLGAENAMCSHMYVHAYIYVLQVAVVVFVHWIE